MRIAMVSEHASPLAALGGVDAGGQNVHVAALSPASPRAGTTSRSTPGGTTPARPSGCRLGPGVDVVHVPAGPPTAAEGRAAAVHAGVRTLACRLLDRAARRIWCTLTSGCPAWRRCRQRRHRECPGGADLPRPGHGQAPSSGSTRHQPGRSGSARRAGIGRRADLVIATCYRRGRRTAADGRAARKDPGRCPAVSTPGCSLRSHRPTN